MAPTPTPVPRRCPLKWLKGTSAGVPDLDIFYLLRDLTFDKTVTGQRYTDLYRIYSPEIISLLSADPILRAEVMAVLQLWETNLQALVNGQGDDMKISTAQVQDAVTFLDHLAAVASPELHKVIAAERARLPWDQLAGQTMDQAWLSIQEDASRSTPDQPFIITPTPSTKSP